MIDDDLIDDITKMVELSQRRGNSVVVGDGNDEDCTFQERRSLRKVKRRSLRNSLTNIFSSSSSSMNTSMNTSIRSIDPSPKTRKSILGLRRRHTTWSNSNHEKNNDSISGIESFSIPSSRPLLRQSDNLS